MKFSDHDKKQISRTGEDTASVNELECAYDICAIVIESNGEE